LAYCRYREISPVCLGKNRELSEQEATLEHLIPKSRLRQTGFRDRFGLRGLNTSSPENTDTSCRQCNALKKNCTDVEFAWKLRYFSRYGLDLRSRSKLARSLRWQQDAPLLPPKRQAQLLNTLMFGECSIRAGEAMLSLGHLHVRLKEGKVTEVWRKP
jgi:hypothetical protein